MQTLYADFGRQIGKIKEVNGINNGPLTARFTIDHTQDFREARIPYSRLHDTEGSMGSGEFVNIHCVFPDFNADPELETSYRFEYTDLYLKAIQNAGTKVFYRLGETIENNYKFIRTYTHPPKDFKKWAKICEGIIRHYNEGWANGLYMGIEYWEIWNEPDGLPNWSGTPEEFYELYAITARHLKACFPEIKIGGYGSTGCFELHNDKQAPLDPNIHGTALGYMEGFFRYITAEPTKAPLDFFSWHCYTNKIENMQKETEYVRQLLDRYGFVNTQSILDEWNYMVDWSSQEGLVRKSMLGAAMVSGTLSMLQKSDVDLAMYYDAEPNRMQFCGLFDAYLQKRTKTYYTFLAFAELLNCKNEIFTDESGSVLHCVGAKDDTGACLLVTNYQAGDVNTEIKIDGLATDKAVTAEFYTLDEEKDLSLTRKEYIYGGSGSLFLYMKENSITMIRFQQ